jgi:hypothetical protein
MSSQARPRALNGGAQLIHGWWAPAAQYYIEEVGATTRGTRLFAPPQTPPTTLVTEGALERREALPSPPRKSCFIVTPRFLISVISANDRISWVKPANIGQT